MTLLGFRLENELKDELESNFENELRFAENITSFMELLKERKYEAVVIDETNLQQDALVNLVKKITETHKRSVIIIMGETSNLKLVAGVIKAGAYDYILKPISPKDVNKILEKAVKDHKLLAERVDRNKNTGDKLIGQTKEIVEVYKMIGRVSNSRIPVLVVGEKGTGKSSVATAIHQFSDWNSKPFLTVNCTSFQNNLLERKLFGYEKGAFEGAAFLQIGDLEKANGGTLHLGNIESLSLDMQSKILYLLQEGEFFRMGGSEPIEMDIRIVATTSENLEELINKKMFIDELYNKLKILEINIPPLRDRKDDIPFIIDHYLASCNLELHKAVKGVSKPAMKKIMRYDWPGNVNELKNAIKSAVALCRGSSILIEELPGNVTGNKISKRKGDNQSWVLTDWIEGELLGLKNNKQNNYYGIIISKVEKELIRQVLEITSGKKVETAELLGITRNTLRTKMNNYGLE
ncbi:sigma-54-dependent transcriptional regulator [Cetobacterium sp.]|uniref:sigma-54-dependent transcriptional regulator n=1 Tax=Cetobacterium sp. TaxID=2071632 RepID=UPI003F3797EA